jgi:hypothetical protein
LKFFRLIYAAFCANLTIVLHHFEPVRSTFFGTGWRRWVGKQERHLRSQIFVDFFAFLLDLRRGL